MWPPDPDPWNIWLFTKAGFRHLGSAPNVNLREDKTGPVSGCTAYKRGLRGKKEEQDNLNFKKQRLRWDLFPPKANRIIIVSSSHFLRDINNNSNKTSYWMNIPPALRRQHWIFNHDSSFMISSYKPGLSIQEQGWPDSRCAPMAPWEKELF